MDSNYMPLPERISKQFSEVDSDIVMDLWKNSPPYKALKQQMEEMKKQNPFIMQLLEGQGAVCLPARDLRHPLSWRRQWQRQALLVCLASKSPKPHGTPV